MNRLMTLTAAALMLTGVSTGAQAATITFDGVSSYNRGQGPVGGLSSDATNIYYQEDGFLLTFSGGPSGHIGDGTGIANTFNWHDGPANLTGTTVTLTQQGGGAFDLTSFVYWANNATMTVTAVGGAYAPLFLSGTGTANPAFTGVSSVTFVGNSFSLGIDNLVVSAAGAVPEPATWAMLILGFGAVGGAMRRRSATAKVARMQLTYA